MEQQLNPADARATGAYEFGRQMSSNVLKSKFPSYKCVVNLVEDKIEPIVSAEFVNGEKWNLPNPTAHAMDLRSQFFSKIQDIEDFYELEYGGLNAGGEEDVGAAAKGGKGAAGGKGGGKK